MASYLLSWWYGPSTINEQPDSTTNESSSSSSQTISQQSLSKAGPSPVAVTISLPTTENDLKADDDNDSVHDDTPPAFPSLNSIQRSASPRKSKNITDKELMPPPAIPALLAPPSNSNLSLPMTSNLRGHPNLLPLPTQNFLRIPSGSSGSSNTLQLPPSTTRAPSAPFKQREKVALAPGHSPLDWAALKASGEDLRGTSTLMRITPSELKKHRRRDDAWSAFNGKVYNITPYLSFHPGGVKELMRVAGRDGTELFASTHAWVNVDFMLDECMVGFLVPEPSSAA